MKRAIAGRRRPRRADKRGVALVMTLGAITVLTVFLTELQDQTAAELSAALSERDALRAEYYARSAVNLARMVIAIEPEVRKAIPMLGSTMPQIPVWYSHDILLGSFNDQAGAESFNTTINADAVTGKSLGLTGGGHYELKIVDEDSKININTAAQSLPDARLRQAVQLLGLFSPQSYNPMFEGRDADNQFSDRQTICGAIVDWADDDEDLYGCDPRGASDSKGAEDNFYQTIGLGYRRKNAAFDSLDELRLVRGVSDDFWSTFVDPDPTDPSQRILTVWGQDKINLNTANAQTLLTLVCGEEPTAALCNDPLQLQGFISVVAMVRRATLGAPLFQKVDDFILMMEGKGQYGAFLAGPPVNMTPVVFRSRVQFKKRLGLRSKMFSIYAEGVVPGFKRTTRVKIHAVADFRSAAELAPPTSAAAPTPAPAPPGANPAGAIVYWRVE